MDANRFTKKFSQEEIVPQSELMRGQLLYDKLRVEIVDFQNKMEFALSHPGEFGPSGFSPSKAEGQGARGKGQGGER